MRLKEFLARFGGLSDEGFLTSFDHPFLLEEGKLRVEGGGAAERQVFLLRTNEGKPLIVGRGPTLEISIQDKQVSSKHAELRFASGSWFILDTGSTNGTFLDGKRISPNNAQPLNDTAAIRFGPDAAYVFLTAKSFKVVLRRIQEREAEGSGGGTATADLDAKTEASIPARAVRDAARSDRLAKGPDLFLVCEGVDPVRLDLGKPVILGRSPQHAQMLLANTQVSRAHAEVVRTARGVMLRDLGSANGTFYCQVKVGENPVEVFAGKPITLGPFTVTLQGPPSDAGMTIMVNAKDVEGVDGRLDDTPLSDLLQDIEAQQKTGILDVFGGGRQGRITFRSGIPHEARSDDGRTGIDAVRVLLKLKTGAFILRADPAAVGARRIDKTFADILLEDFLG
jgi:pSer/pThr/pTyr-binding forkhead associated (FHA) protein